MSGACSNAEAEEVCTSAAFYHWQCQANQVKGICRYCPEKVGQKTCISVGTDIQDLLLAI